MNYTPIHVHSDYSLLDSTTKFEQLADAAKECGMKAIATTEHGLHRGYIHKKLYCDSIGIKLLFGVEVYMTEELEPKVRDNYHTILIAKNQEGLMELNRLIRLSTTENHTFYKNRISFADFMSISSNIITTSACIASPLNRISEQNPWFEKLIKKYDYLEIQPHIDKDQADFNRRLVELSGKYGKPLVVGTDTHSINKYAAECRKVLQEAKEMFFDDEDNFDLTFKKYDEVVEMFRLQGAVPEEVYLEALENTNRIADMCDDINLDTTIKYPILHGSYEEDEKVFEETVERMFDEKLSTGVIPKSEEQGFRDSIVEEMRVLKKLNMCGFMLSMSEIIRWCHDNGIPTGPGRGSVGGSRVAYITDIIDTDPEKWNTVFSRFANEDREEIGDIDTDVIDTDRPKIFKYLIERFGADLTARVASYGTIQDKKVVDEVGRALAFKWKRQHPNDESNNPYSIAKLSKIKAEYDQDPEKAKKDHKDIFYYFDGLIDTKISQSVHPAGMVLSPISLSENYGTFLKDGEWCLLLDMDEVHDGCGLAKYDFLILKTVKLIKDACEYAGVPYPKSNEIDWGDKKVWEDMRRDQTGIFQFTEAYAAECFRKFKTNSIEDMSLVTASIRPSGASYRNELLSRVVHRNPSELIDNLLKNNNGYLVYQEDIIAFLKEVCGLSGSYADTVRRGIARKKTELLEKAMPDILNGYCEKSSKPREVAESECKEFLRIIEDASSYMFGYNHSIEYCLVGYLCGYLRYYYPIEFITSYLNNAAKEKEVIDGAKLAKLYGIKITNPRFGISKSDYAFSREMKTIAKGLSSIKYIGDGLAEELFALSRSETFDCFVDLLTALEKTSIDSKQISILISIDFFADFGNQRELTRIREMFDAIHGRKSIKRDDVENSPYAELIRKYSVDKRKDGKQAASYTIVDEGSILRECEEKIRLANLSDYSVNYKVKSFADVMGYVAYTTDVEEDRPKLYVRDVEPVKRKKDGKKFGYAILTQSIGSGKESRMTVFNELYDKDPIKKGDIIYCSDFRVDAGGYFTLTSYYHMRDEE